MRSYSDFLHTKVVKAPVSGFAVDPAELNPVLKPHQRDAVAWALRGGRRALFESFGLGKTVQELEFCHQVARRTGGRALIILPLGVRQEFTRDAVELLGYDAPVYVTTMAEASQTEGEILMTNYERVRDGDIDPTYFTAVAMDEASVLRSFGSKTYQVFLPKFRGVPYKLVSTATPSPNRYKELIHYAGYLEIMDTGQAL
ncbi:MAG: DNA methylase N-4, partial [Evtepia sp.]|nr:DNA methylase N-4 [Evtepia sp.]